MNRTLTLLAAAVSSAIVLSGATTTLAQSTAPPPPEPIFIGSVAGTVGIHHTLPARCGAPLDLPLQITGGRIDLSHFISDGFDWFDLMRLDVSVEPFEVGRNCDGISGSVAFSIVGFRLANTVRFRGEEIGALGSGKFAFTIPKEQFTIYQSVVDNLNVRQPQAEYQRPNENVTGQIDLAAQTVFFDVGVATQQRFRAGCVRGHCVIDETDFGNQTAHITGNPDACHAPSPSTRPVSPTQLTASCTVVDPRAQTFQVGADEGCNTALAIHLGPYVVADGEVIRIQPASRPGVRLLNSTSGGLRQFQVGPGAGIVVATDGTNTARAVCQ